MPTPATRTPVRIARGTYSDLNSSIADLQEGEICYATDQNKFYAIEGGALTEQPYLPTAGGTVTGNLEIGIAGSLTFEGSTADGSETTLAVTDPTADRTVTLPDATGTVSLLSLAQTFTAGQRGEITTLTDAATVLVDFADSNHFSVTLAGNRTLDNPTNQVAGQSGSLFVIQDATGSRTLAYSSDWEFAGATAPTLSTAASTVDRIDYIVRASGNIHAVFTAAYS